MLPTLFPMLDVPLSYALCASLLCFLRSFLCLLCLSPMLSVLSLSLLSFSAVPNGSDLIDRINT